MNVKKYISALAVSLLLVFSFAFSAAAATAVDSSADDVITGKITADGTKVTVQVNLAADSALTNGKVTVTYDTSVYTLESAVLGAAAEAADISDLNTEAAGTVSAALAETVGNTAGGTILTVVLTAASEDDVTTPVTVTLDEAGTADGDVTVADDSFELTAVDKTELQAAVEDGDALEESDYTEDSWAAYQEALEAAEAVLADEDATQEEADAAYAALLAAMEGLTVAETPESVDKSDLEALVEESESLEASEYTEDSWTAYQEVLEEVATVLADENATQEEIDAAYESLLAAIEGLETASADAGVVDKTELEELAGESGSLDESEYTEDSWAAYQEALEEVETVLADENATQEDVDAAYEKLQAAIDALEAAETESSTEEATDEATDEATEADASATDGTADDSSTTAASSDGNLSTGDRNLTPLWILLILSLAGAIMLAVKGKRQTV